MTDIIIIGDLAERRLSSSPCRLDRGSAQLNATKTLLILCESGRKIASERIMPT